MLFKMLFNLDNKFKSQKNTGFFFQFNKEVKNYKFSYIYSIRSVCESYLELSLTMFTAGSKNFVRSQL